MEPGAFRSCRPRSPCAHWWVVGSLPTLPPPPKVAEDFGVGVERVFALCGELGLNLSRGLRTHLRRDEHRLLCAELAKETGLADPEEGAAQSAMLNPQDMASITDPGGFKGFYDYERD